MSAATMHLALGLLLGTLWTTPRVWACWRAGQPLAGVLGRALLVTYGLACFAVFPSLLRRLGVPAAVCEGWWMNVFLGYPLLNRLRAGGLKLGALLIFALFALHYGVLLLAIRRAAARQSPTRRG